MRALLLLLLLLGFGGPAYAQAPPPDAAAGEAAGADASQLYKEGVGLFKQGDFPAAAERFQAAYNLDPSPILLYNLARASEEMGDAEAAILHYRAYLARYPAAEDRAAVEKSIRILSKITEARREGTLFIDGLPEDAAVAFNHAPAPASNADGGWTLVAGTYLIEVRTPNGGKWDQEIDVLGAETLRVPYGGGAGLGLEGGARPPVEGGGLRPLQLWGYIAAGSGVALVAGAVYFGVRSDDAADKHNRLRDEIASAGRAPTPAILQEKNQAETDANNNALAANILYGVGGAAVAAGVTLIVLDLLDAPASTASVAPLPGGVAIVGRF